MILGFIVGFGMTINHFWKTVDNITTTTTKAIPRRLRFADAASIDQTTHTTCLKIKTFWVFILPNFTKQYIIIAYSRNFLMILIG